MCGVLFLKDPTYQMIKNTHRYNPDSFFYSFEYEGRNSIFIYLFPNEKPPIPHGKISFIIVIKENIF